MLKDLPSMELVNLVDKLTLTCLAWQLSGLTPTNKPISKKKHYISLILASIRTSNLTKTGIMTFAVYIYVRRQPIFLINFRTGTVPPKRKGKSK